MKGFRIYTDGWWRNPKNAVTTDATLVEVSHTVRQGGGPAVNAGYYQSVVADVSDPETGQTVRADAGDVYSGLEPFQVGQRITVRWSAKRKTFALYSWNTAPEDEWGGQAGAGRQAPGEAIPGAGATVLSGGELSPDQTARMQQALGALGISGTSGVQVVPTPGAGAGGGQPDPIVQLEKLAELRKSGALTDEEFEQQKRRVLGEQ